MQPVTMRSFAKTHVLTCAIRSNLQKLASGAINNFKPLKQIKIFAVTIVIKYTLLINIFKRQKEQ